MCDGHGPAPSLVPRFGFLAASEKCFSASTSFLSGGEINTEPAWASRGNILHPMQSSCVCLLFSIRCCFHSYALNRFRGIEELHPFPSERLYLKSISESAQFPHRRLFLSFPGEDFLRLFLFVQVVVKWHVSSAGKVASC